MTCLRFAGSLIAAVLLTACSDPGKPTESSSAPLSPPSLGNAGSTSGAMVVRGEAFFLYVIFDAEAGMAAALNGRDGIRACGEDFTVSRPGRFQQVISPKDELLIKELFKADAAFVFVYAWDGVLPPDEDALCALLTGPRIARGTAHFVNNDNDLVSFLRDPVRANSFGLAANGVVTFTTGGGTARFNAVSRIVALPSGKVNETARIGLTPIR